ncbi:MAG TPA: response regulator [Noviherbaspirillum sp.]|nr:response regulator [Noviherbaspirillum sp.]
MLSEFHFLVVDDMPTVRWIVSSLLREIGCMKVSEAEDGEQALKLLARGCTFDSPINFIVTDWNMPVMSGMALLRAIRTTADLAHLPVLMVTSQSDDESIAAAAEAGADGYIIKAFLNAQTLRNTLDYILRERRCEA